MLTRPEGAKVKAEGRSGEGFLGRGGYPTPHQLEGLASAVSSPSEVWGRAPEAKRCCSILTVMYGHWW